MSTSYYIGETIFSAGGVLTDIENKKVYLVYKNASGEWLLPKGRLENGETIEAAAQREIFEETGYENKVKNLLSTQIRPDVNDPSKTKVIFWFFASLESGNQRKRTQMENESFAGKWFSKEEAIESLKYDEDKSLINKVFDQLD